MFRKQGSQMVRFEYLLPAAAGVCGWCAWRWRISPSTNEQLWCLGRSPNGTQNY